MLSDHRGVDLEISNRKMLGTFPNIVTISDTFLNNPRVKEGGKLETAWAE